MTIRVAQENFCGLILQLWRGARAFFAILREDGNNMKIIIWTTLLGPSWVELSPR
jgi:hypothetical protein